MDDTLNQFRRRLAQINGVKLNEAPLTKRALGRAVQKRQELLYKQHVEKMNKEGMERSSAIQLYHDEMRNNTRNGLSGFHAHKEAMKAVENEHGKSGIVHLHRHFNEIHHRPEEDPKPDERDELDKHVFEPPYDDPERGL
jgi:hypothetical protein